MSYIAYAWLTATIYGVGAVVGKIASNHQVKNPWLFNITWSFFTVLFVLPFAIVNRVGFPTDWPSMIHLGIAGTASSITFILAYYAVDLSVLSPMANLRTPVAALIGLFFFGENINLWQWFLIAILFISGIFVAYDDKSKLRAFMSKKILLALSWIFASVWFSAAIKQASISNGFWEVSLWSSILTFMFLLPTYPLFIKDVKKTKITEYSGVLLTTVFFTAGLLASVKAFGENVGLTTAIISLPISMVLTIILAQKFPNLLEKHPNSVYAIRLAAATVMFLSAIGLSK